MVYSHIVWTTFLTWQPNDIRGEWNDLRDLYIVDFEGLDLYFSDRLHKNYKHEVKKYSVTLDLEQRQKLKEIIQELSANNGDRIAGSIPILDIGINQKQIHLFVRCKASLMKQKIARLKSRSATLLKFNSTSAKNTWSKGIWFVEITEQADLSKIESFFHQIRI